MVCAMLCSGHRFSLVGRMSFGTAGFAAEVHAKETCYILHLGGGIEG
jgi:hypothetical protein